MTVKELIALLVDMPEDAEILYQDGSEETTYDEDLEKDVVMDESLYYTIDGVSYCALSHIVTLL
jgi:hypothetical protein